MSQTQIRKIGDALGVALPKDVLDRLKVGEGDALFVVETPDGLVLSRREQAVAQVDVMRDIARRYDGAMRILAK